MGYEEIFKMIKLNEFIKQLIKSQEQAQKTVFNFKINTLIATETTVKSLVIPFSCSSNRQQLSEILCIL